ncbi:MAG: hypothetical protein VX822_01210, partial [Candidatus Neomarinimicrobiota bacterium]|nr:hypothetical protein [Candidatus Neomarinimicrobiota bacterium]
MDKEAHKAKLLGRNRPSILGHATLIFFLSCFTPLLYGQDFRQTVAVIDFDASGISQLEATSLTNRFRTAVGDVGMM